VRDAHVELRRCDRLPELLRDDARHALRREIRRHHDVGRDAAFEPALEESDLALRRLHRPEHAHLVEHVEDAETLDGSVPRHAPAAGFVPAQDERRRLHAALGGARVPAHEQVLRQRGAHALGEHAPFVGQRVLEIVASGHEFTRRVPHEEAHVSRARAERGLDQSHGFVAVCRHLASVMTG